MKHKIDQTRKKEKKIGKMQEQVLFLGRILSHYSTYTAWKNFR